MRTLAIKTKASAILLCSALAPALSHGHDGHAMTGTVFHGAEHGLWLFAGLVAAVAVTALFRKRLKRSGLKIKD